jgi:hypothetical protein
MHESRNGFYPRAELSPVNFLWESADGAFGAIRDLVNQMPLICDKATLRVLSDEETMNAVSADDWQKLRQKCMQMRQACATERKETIQRLYSQQQHWPLAHLLFWLCQDSQTRSADEECIRLNDTVLSYGDVNRKNQEAALLDYQLGKLPLLNVGGTAYAEVMDVAKWLASLEPERFAQCIVKPDWLCAYRDIAYEGWKPTITSTLPPEIANPNGYRTSVTDRMVMRSCFISFSSKDQGFADLLYGELLRNSVRCWYAPYDLPIGGKTRDEIKNAIESHDRLLLVLSRNSISSDWVEYEVETALEKGRRTRENVLFPIYIDESFFESNLGWVSGVRNIINAGCFTEWQDEQAFRLALDKLLQDLRLADQ